MMPYSVLVTGGIGGGKSTVCRYLERRGVPVYYSDTRTKALYTKDAMLLDSLERAFGKSLRDAQGNFSSKALADIVFSSEDAMRECERIVHPAVLADFLAWRSSFDDFSDWCGYCGNIPFVCLESAIALDKPLFDKSYDSSVFVTADIDIRLERVKKRDNADVETIRRRIQMQADRSADADYVIWNNTSEEELEIEIDRVFEQLIDKFRDIVK